MKKTSIFEEKDEIDAKHYIYPNTIKVSSDSEKHSLTADDDKIDGMTGCGSGSVKCLPGNRHESCKI